VTKETGSRNKENNEIGSGKERNKAIAGAKIKKESKEKSPDAVRKGQSASG
jgi:hypothetical protein